MKVFVDLQFIKTVRHVMCGNSSFIPLDLFGGKDFEICGSLKLAYIRPIFVI